MLGANKLRDFKFVKRLKGYAIKEPVFSFHKFPDVNKELGPRTEQEIHAQREREVDQQRLTSLDRAIGRQAGRSGVVVPGVVVPGVVVAVGSTPPSSPHPTAIDKTATKENATVQIRALRGAPRMSSASRRGVRGSRVGSPSHQPPERQDRSP